MWFKFRRSNDQKNFLDPTAKPVSRKRDLRRSLMKAVVVFAVGSIFTWQIWGLIVNRRLPTLQEIVEESVDGTRARLNSFLEERVSHLQVLAQVLGYRPPLSQSEFELASQDLTAGFPEWKWIQYHLPELPQVWSDPFVVNGYTEPEDLRSLIKQVESERPFEELREKSIFVYPLDKKTEQFYAVRIIIRREKAASGVMWAVLDTSDLLKEFFHRENQEMYHHIVSIHGKTLATDLGYHDALDKNRPYQVTRNLIWMGYVLRIDIWPKPYYIYSRAMDLNVDLAGIVILVMGLLFSAASAVLTWNVSARTRLLQVEVERRTVELIRKNDLLRAKNDEIENFIYTISHDLKSPIVSIQGFTSILKEEFSKNLGESGASYLERVMQNTVKMHHLIQDLLELSRIGQVEDKSDTLDTGKLVQDVINEHRNEIDKKHIHILVQPQMPTVKFPKVRMLQVLDNLITNAIKYSDDKKNPEISVGANGIKGEDDFYHFVVKDNGIGIEKEYHEKIFQIFQRVHVDKNIEGTGIGLSIVKKIVEKYGGSIRVSSEPGVGSKFEFSIPKEMAA